MRMDIKDVGFTVVSSDSLPPFAMVLKLYGTCFSVPAKVVMLVLREKNVPFEFIPVDVFGKEQKTPEYLEKQPFGQIPYLDDDGFILYESRAIARYIEEKYSGQGPDLIPKGLKQRALFEQAASIEYGNFSPNVAPIVTEAILKPLFGGTSDQQKIEQDISVLAAKLDVYDRILSKQKYLAGDELTLADLFHIPWAAMFSLTGSKVFDERPNVARWMKDLMERESWQLVKEPTLPTL